MNRRSSVSAAQIVLGNPKAASHYQRLRQNPLNGVIQEEKESRVESWTLELPNGRKVTVEADPLLIAENLLLKESGDYDIQDHREATSPEEAGKTGTYIRSSFTASRKRSAIDEGMRVEASLRAAGVLLDD